MRARPPGPDWSLRSAGDSRDGKHFRAAGGAVQCPIRQEAHLRVTAFACVPAQSVGQRDYLLEGQQRRRAQDALTRAAACTFTIEGAYLTRLADRTDKVIRSGCQ